LNLHLNLSFRNFCAAQFGIVTAVLFLGVSAYVFANLTGHGGLLGFWHLLDVDDEQSLPTFVSVLNLFLASILLFVIFVYEKSGKQKGATYWLFLSLLFLHLSFDESASVHEKFGNVYIYLVEKGIISPLLNAHEWLPFGIVFILVVPAILIPFIRNLESDTRRNFVVAGCVFVFGAVGAEGLQSFLRETGIIVVNNQVAYSYWPLLEEGLEMYGIVLFNCALYYEILKRKITVVIDSN